MPLPNIIGIGAQRAATTWVYECLREHPEVFMPSVKEVHFFNNNYQKGMEWYEEFFKPAGDYSVIGEITPNYLNIPDAIPRMAADLPNAKLFIILREPISRAYSAYKLLNKEYGKMSFQEACESSEYLLRLSRYANDLKRVYEYYPEEQVKIFLYDDVRKTPDTLLIDLFKFIGVDETYKPAAVNAVFNPVLMPRAQKVFNAMGLGGAIEKFKTTALGEMLKKTLTKRQSVNVNHKQKKQQHAFASDEYLAHLKHYFRDDILQVQDIIKRDLSDWL